MHNWLSALTTSSLLLALLLEPIRCALDPNLMQQHLTRGAPILGTFTSSGRLSDWMSVYDDGEPIININIPGTHDSCAWDPTGVEASILQTQDVPIFEQLNGGIRFLDIRFGSNNGTLQLYHDVFLLSQTAQLEDVLWGLYNFLDAHPTETIIVSLKVDEGQTDSTLQQDVFNMLTTPPVSDYWVLDADFGTLGAARHKLILFRRFTFAGTLPFGIDVSNNWVDNNADFAIPYDPSTQSFAFVEDLYQLNLGNVSADVVVQTKLNAFEAHIENAGSGSNTSQAFVTFASGGGLLSTEYVTPELLAVGSTAGKLQGINIQISSFLESKQGGRFGIIPLDFFETPESLALDIISNSKVVANASAPEPAPPSSTASSGGTSSTPISSARRAVVGESFYAMLFATGLILCGVAL